MTYKYSKGNRKFGDIEFEGDTNTEIDFEDDYIALEAAGNAVLVVSGSQVGIGTTTPTEALTINGVEGQSSETMIKFTEDGNDRALIGINLANNILIENLFSNKHIVFKASDAGVSKEGLRLDGAVPEVVVNQNGASGQNNTLVDFRVESDNNTHMLYVDGANDRVAIDTSTPNSGLHVNTSVAFAGKVISQNYTATASDHMIFVNAGQSSVTLSLPTAVGIAGRQYIIKRVDGNGQNQVTVDPNGSQTIEGAVTKSIENQNSIVIVSDNSNWWIVSEFITPP
jgi:hypothetical protein